MSEQVVLFSYNELPSLDQLFIQEKAEDIKIRLRKSVSDIIEIGSSLIEVKARLAHGQWGLWLESEFGWTDRTALNFMNVARQFGKSETVSDLRIAVSALYLLASPKTPSAARDEALALAGSGERVTKTLAKQIIEKHQVFKAPIGDFKEHPAQMRTVYDLEEMANLALQVYENDLDAWQPIVATPNPEGGYFIISGHRRRMARLFAFAISTWLNHPESDIDEKGLHIELVRQFIDTLVSKYEFVDAAAEALTKHYADQEIEFRLFKGDQKAQILALQRANYGMVKPDMLGIAHSFQAALQTGATIPQIARNIGQHDHYVRNHLALTRIPQELAKQIADGTLPMSIGIAVAEIRHEQKRNGLAQFVLGTPAEQLTAKAIKEVAKTLSQWNGLQLPLTVAHQAQRNIARILVRLWHTATEAVPVRCWAVISSFIYQGTNINTPWEDQQAVETWVLAMGGHHYSDGIQWETLVYDLLDKVNCHTCPIAKLPKRQLRSDLSPGRSDVLGMPCRSRGARRCIHGLAPSDPFHVRVPWDWADHEGVTKESSGYAVHSFEVLWDAWQTQADLEDAEDQTAKQAEEPIDEPTHVSKATYVIPEPADEPTHVLEATYIIPEPLDEPTYAPEPAGEPTHVSEATYIVPEPVSEPMHIPPSVPEPTHVSEFSKTLAPSPITWKIANFMAWHLAMNVDHPFATPCVKCQHKLAFPTKNKSVPRCAWAGRTRFVEFLALEPIEGGKPIPVCRQFAPKGRWADIILAHPEKAIMPREWVKHQLHQLAKAYPSSSPSVTRKPRQLFEFLTGRPMSPNEKHDGWFLDELQEQAHELSDEQLWTLFVWALAEWQRGTETTPFMAPDHRNSHFISLREIDFQHVKE